MTDEMKLALFALRRRNGKGTFNEDGALVAAGQWVPIDRITWDRLRDAGMVEEHQDHLRITPLGLAFCWINEDDY